MFGINKLTRKVEENQQLIMELMAEQKFAKERKPKPKYKKGETVKYRPYSYPVEDVEIVHVIVKKNKYNYGRDFELFYYKWVVEYTGIHESGRVYEFNESQIIENP